MNCVKTSFIVFVVLTFFEIHQCGRYGGSSDDSEIQSTVGPDNSRPKLEALAYVRSSTRRVIRSSTTGRPTTTRRPPTTTRRPPTTTRLWVVVTTRRPTTTRRPPTTTRRPPTTTRRPPTTTKPWVIVTTRRPPPTTRRPPTTTRRPPTTTRRPPTTTRRPPMTTTRRWIPTTTQYYKKDISWVDLPPPPGSKIKHGKTEIKIVNKYNYHYPGFYSIPVQHPHIPGYYQTYTTYHYHQSDTGSGILGFYLGYKLGKLTTPTYSHESFYDGYRPRYDHYTVHHYYHNADAVPKRQEIVSNKIVGCVGDSTSICPANTTSLCTTDGKLMCVVPVTSLVTCKDTNNQIVNCTSSTISCVNNTAPECAGTNNKNVVVSIPCVSTARIYGNITFVNNTIVKHTLPANATNNMAPVQNVSLSTTGNVYVNNPDFQPSGNVYVNNSDGVPTTTPTTSVYWKWKRSIPQKQQEFCVTIVASPAERKPTAGEEFLEDANTLVRKFFEVAWNL